MSDDPDLRPPKLIGGVSFSDIVVDVLGSLVPGLLFVIGAVFGTLVPIADIVRHSKVDAGALGLLVTGATASTALILAMSVAILVLSFVIGTMFYRMDPKRVDLRSARLLNSSELLNGMVGADCIKEGKVEFPYKHLRRYLSHRGLTYLAERIPWDAESENGRTKHFINALKLRLAVSNPEIYSHIARNEAHVRLASSLWYASGYGIVMGAVGSALLATVSLLGLDGVPASSSATIAYISAAFVVISCFMLRTSIEKTFHYQRVREVLHILELAHWCGVAKSSIDIFDGSKTTEQPQSVQSVCAHTISGHE